LSEPRVCADTRKKVKNILLLLQKKSRRRATFTLVEETDRKTLRRPSKRPSATQDVDPRNRTRP